MKLPGVLITGSSGEPTLFDLADFGTPIDALATADEPAHRIFDPTVVREERHEAFEVPLLLRGEIGVDGRRNLFTQRREEFPPFDPWVHRNPESRRAARLPRSLTEWAACPSRARRSARKSPGVIVRMQRDRLHSRNRRPALQRRRSRSRSVRAPSGERSGPRPKRRA